MTEWIPGANCPTQAQIDAAGAEVYASLARQDARAPRDAAIHALGRDVTEQQITDWIQRFRPRRTGGDAPSD
jgi:hypothetical protein